MPCYPGDLTHYTHHGIFPNVSGRNEALSVPAWGGVNMLSRIKMTRNPAAEDRVKSTFVLKFMGTYSWPLIATLGGCRLSLGTQRDPISLCRLDSTQSSLGSQSHPCWGANAAGPAQLKAQGVGAGSPSLWF